MIVRKAYKFKIKINSEQKAYFSRVAGCVRIVWNKSLALLTHEGQLYAFKPGQALGAQGGEVTQVNADHLWLRQWVADSHGQWQARSNRWPVKGAP